MAIKNRMKNNGVGVQTPAPTPITEQQPIVATPTATSASQPISQQPTTPPVAQKPQVPPAPVEQPTYDPKLTTQQAIHNNVAQKVEAFHKEPTDLEKWRAYQKQLEEATKLDPNEEKRRRSNQLIAAISDGVRSIANLYFTTKGAPNAYDPTTSMSERMRKHYEKIDAERKANYGAFRDYMERQRQAQAEQARKDREWEYKVEKDAADAKFKRQQHDDNMAVKNEELGIKGKTADSTIAVNNARAGKIGEEIKWVAPKAKAEIASRRASANASNARAENLRRVSKEEAEKGIRRGRDYTYRIPIGNNEYQDIPKDYFNDAVLAHLFEEAGMSTTIKEKQGYRETERPMRKDEMIAEIGRQAGKDPKLQNALRRLIGTEQLPFMSEDDLAEYEVD